MAEADLSILKMQKTCACISGGIDLQSCRFPRAGIERQSAGLSHLMGLSPTSENKKSHTFGCGISYLVDDIGLEPMTFRTSSGCSSQLS